jgi:glycosyltransferase involved in cell wall biosynthesis
MSRPFRVVHLLDSVTGGGGARSVLNLARASARLGPFAHEIVCLRPASPEGLRLAREAGVPVAGDAPLADVAARIAAADIVQVNYWNHPLLNRLLRAPLPPMRLVVLLHVAGDTAPQVVTPELVRFADVAVACSPHTHGLPAFAGLPARRTAMVYPPADLARVHGVRPRAHRTFNVGYIGTVDFVKMHADFVAMSAGIDVPDLRVVVCGAPSTSPDTIEVLRRQAAALRRPHAFEFRGYVEDIRPVLAELDVYGYPLCEATYACSELNLQEVMYAGIPPVIFPHGGACSLVQHGQTGLVVRDAAGYRSAIEHLHRNPAERRRLGRNARRFARARLGARNAARQMHRVYEELLAGPKRPRAWPGGDGASGARLFLEAMGRHGEPFRTSLDSGDVQEVLAAEQWIGELAARNRMMRTAGYGSVQHYLRFAPDDARLRLWAGLLLERDGQLEAAVHELTEAVRLGAGEWRVHWYLARAASQLGDVERARCSLDAVLAAAPSFAPARDLRKRLA